MKASDPSESVDSGPARPIQRPWWRRGTRRGPGRRSVSGRLLTASTGVLAGALALTVTGSAPAQAAWTTAWKVSANGWTATDWPQVAVDRQGDALLVWEACDSAATYCYHQVQARIRTAAGSMGAIMNLSALGKNVAWPMVDSDDDGDSAVVWEQDGHVVGRRVSKTGALTTLRTLSTSAPAMNPVVAVSPTGTAIAAWSEVRNGAIYTVARHINLDGTVGPTLVLGSGAADPPAIAIDRTGLAVVAWTEGNMRVVAKRVKPGYVSGLRALTTTIASSGGFGMVKAAVDRDGDAVITYRSAGGQRPRVWASRWGRTNTLSTPIAVSPSTDNVGFHHALASDLEGDSVLVWTRRNSSNQIELFGRSLTRTGTLGAITRLGLYDRPDIALDDDGDGMVVAHVPDAPYKTQQVFSRLISRTGSFGTAKTLTTDGRVPQVDVNPTGRATTTWQQETYPYQIHGITGP
ncbi:hypothetical protein [Actinopolymorpha alba]|uniref:hypothetical protein n=1 Tax=Actinopolymorpha alba TaxID=533267 RepID=UPI00036CD4B5|nr:hypothetical protein [Actinopolymorpha alba]